jgi:hypothetical protein
VWRSRRSEPDPFVVFDDELARGIINLLIRIDDKLDQLRKELLHGEEEEDT